MMTRISGAAAMTASAVCRISRRIFGNCSTTAAKPMIDSSSIGNSEVSPSRAMARPPTPSNCTASPRRWRSTFIRPAPSRSPDSSVAIRNILRPTLAPGARRTHAATPVTNRPAASAAAIMACGSATMRVAGDDRDAGKPAPRARPRPSRADGRQIEAQILAALRRLHQHAAPGGGADAALLAQPRDPRQQAVGALDILDADDMAVDHDHGLPDVERAQRAQHLASPARCRPRPARPARRAVRHPAGISRSGATSLIPTMRKPSCSRMRPMPDNR